MKQPKNRVFIETYKGKDLYIQKNIEPLYDKYPYTFIKEGHDMDLYDYDIQQEIYTSDNKMLEIVDSAETYQNFYTELVYMKNAINKDIYSPIPYTEAIEDYIERQARYMIEDMQYEIEDSDKDPFEVIEQYI